MRTKIKFHVTLSLVVLLFVGCKVQQKVTSVTITLANDSDIELSEKAVAVNRNLIDRNAMTKGFPLLIFKSDTIPSQVNDLDGDGKWDELFLVTHFSPKEQKTIQLKWVKEMPKFPIRTSVRFGKREAKNIPVQPATEEVLMADQVHAKLGFQKYQTDGPTWENDKVGFRHYLDGRNAKDVFGKRIPAITPENVGINSAGAVEDNYHQMYDWGRDIFPVGNSAGLGGYALSVNNEITRLGIITTDKLNNIEKTTFKIVSEGPENSILNYKYYNWKVSGNQYQVNETTSIWPGMYGYKNTVSINGITGNETFLIALSNINNQKGLKVIEVGDWVCLIQHDNLTYNREWILGTAIIVPKKDYLGYIEAPKTGQLTDSYLAKFKIENNKPISYYAIAGWELSADKNFKDANYFTEYVTNLAKQLAVEITVAIKK
ncbi:DUF4861 domain-containing protein [Flavobacterium cellulosilyticum]|uniref:DUF4861 domain-containing protein n=1 Tax=Flavobacterium cellulosilyticum TaxID=2541731 RepID=A0A4R5CBX5_9FLAO|nr:DUF4861 domain-containing protein [Flavobacterium cellulosilyticum]TDD95723.1 DUF4861 domain-containing protein [Flavobacterium cellulosilyticum]